MAGHGEQHGRLSQQDEKTMKRYQPELMLFNQQEEVDVILSWLRDTFPAT